MTPERIDAIFALLPTYVLELAEDPLALGPKYLQKVVAECRNHLNAVALFQHEVNIEKQAVSRQLRGEKALLDAEQANLLSTHEGIRKLPSIEDRRATINVMLKCRIHEIYVLGDRLEELLNIEKAIKHRYGELTNTMAEIRLQRSLIQAEIKTGAMYGDERKTAAEGGSDNKAPFIMGEVDEEFIQGLLEDEGVG